LGGGEGYESKGKSKERTVFVLKAACHNHVASFHCTKHSEPARLFSLLNWCFVMFCIP
jgi:hypothetical protein